MTEQEGFQRLEKAIIELKDPKFLFIYNSIWRIIGVSLIQARFWFRMDNRSNTFGINIDFFSFSNRICSYYWEWVSRVIRK